MEVIREMKMTNIHTVRTSGLTLSSSIRREGGTHDPRISRCLASMVPATGQLSKRELVD